MERRNIKKKINSLGVLRQETLYKYIYGKEVGKLLEENRKELIKSKWLLNFFLQL